MFRWAPVAVLLLVSHAARAPAVEIVTHPFLGVKRTELINPATIPRPLYVNIIEIDLAEPTLSFRVTPRAPGTPPLSGGIPAETHLQTTRSFLAQQNGQLAINASFYGGTYASPWTNNLGLAVSDGDIYSVWENAQEPIFRNGLNITQANVARVVARHGIQAQGYETSPTVPLYNAVAGSHRLLQNGVVDPNGNFSVGGLNGLNPRTAVGVTNNLDSNGKKLLLMTVDGRQNGFSEGVTLTELANLMAAYGATDAVNLDGGGSTSMMVNYSGDLDSAGNSFGARHMNVPINGNVPGGERSVGANLAMFAAANPNYAAAVQPTIPAGFAVFDSFESDEGRFASSPTASGSTFGVSTASLFDRVLNESYLGLGGQRLTVRTSNPATPGFGLRHLSGDGNPASNTAFASSGSVGFFLKVLQTGVQTGDIQASLLLDDGAAHERAVPIDVIADGQWHLYQWDLDDADEWLDFAGGNGSIDASSVTLDSVYLSSSLNLNFNVFLDAVVHNPSGDLSALTPSEGQAGDFDDDDDVDGADFLAWQRGGSDEPLDGDDLEDWKDHFGASPVVAAASGQFNVPEPTPPLLLALAGGALLIVVREELAVGRLRRSGDLTKCTALRWKTSIVQKSLTRRI